MAILPLATGFCLVPQRRSVADARYGLQPVVCLLESRQSQRRALESASRNEMLIRGPSRRNAFHNKFGEKEAKEVIDVLVSSGLAEAGYTFFNLDGVYFLLCNNVESVRHHSEVAKAACKQG